MAGRTHGALGLRTRVAFDRDVRTRDDKGGHSTVWQELGRAYAEFRYDRGAEERQAGGLTGTAAFKVRVRSTAVTRGLSAADTLRDVAAGVRFNIREVDALSDRHFVWLVAERGVPA